MNIQGVTYKILDVYSNSITLPDSFAVQGNKYGKGHGEAKLYIGSKIQMTNFFGKDRECFVLKDDFVNYEKRLQSAKQVLSSIYKKSISKNKSFTVILKSIQAAIRNMTPKETFDIKLMNQLQGSRGYINSATTSTKGGYNLLRACCIPFVSFIRILKLEDVNTKKVCFYIKLFPSFDDMSEQVRYINQYGKKSMLISTSARPGQIKYKKALIQVFTRCPFTQIEDSRLLIASHIRPFASCSKQEKYDVENGLLLSPLYDKLFDRGFITFDQQGKLKKSIWLSPNDWKKIPLRYTITDLHLTPQRKSYLQFHEQYVFLG